MRRGSRRRMPAEPLSGGRGFSITGARGAETVGGPPQLAGPPRRALERSRHVLTMAALGLMAPAGLGAQWVEKPGEGWVQLVVYHLDTTREYGPTGDEQDYFADGHVVSTSAFLTASAGLFRGVDAWVQVPYHFLTFDDAAGDRSENGIGDPKLFLRLGPGALGLQPPRGFAAALRGGVKLPVDTLPIDSEIVPLTEGQRDWELLLELGRSFYPLPLYAQGWIGYRWREENEGRSRDLGNEKLAFLAVGGSAGPFSWQLAAEGLWGATPILEGLAIETAERKLVQLLPKVGWRAGPGAVELGGRIPVDGQNLPAGSALSFGYFTRW